MLFLCFLIFYKTNIYALIGAMVLSVISLMLTAAGVLESIINFLGITNYLNIFNWVGVFALGMFMKKYLPVEKLYNFLVQSRWGVFIAFNIVAILLVIFSDIKVGYFSYVGIWFELLGTLAILSLSTLNMFDVKFIRDISSFSFTIYLIHMMIIGVFDKIYNMHIVLQIFSSAIVILVCYLLLFVARWFIKLLKAEKYLYPVLGFRERK